MHVRYDDWYGRAIVQLEQDFDDDLLTAKEFRQALKDLDEEYDEAFRKQQDDFY